MIRIRFVRTGKTGQPSFRIVVTPRSNSVRGRSIEVIGNYMPARNPKIVTIDKERAAYWISKGAIPTDSIASLFKKEGMENMEKFMEPRNKQHKKKGEAEAATAAAPTAGSAPAAPKDAAPAKAAESKAAA